MAPYFSHHTYLDMLPGQRFSKSDAMPLNTNFSEIICFDKPLKYFLLINHISNAHNSNILHVIYINLILTPWLVEPGGSMAQLQGLYNIP